MSEIVTVSEMGTKCAMSLESRPPGTYTFTFGIEANGILSTLFVKNVDPGATLQLTYYDAGIGRQFGSKVLLKSHELITDVLSFPFVDQKLVSYFHNSPWVEAEVIGGNVEFGLWVSSRDYTGTTIPMFENGGVPALGYDYANDILRFISLDDSGQLNLSVSNEPVALTGPVKNSTITVGPDQWYVLPNNATSLENRRSLSFQNNTGRLLYINGSNLAAADTGFRLKNNAERNYDARPELTLYVRAASSSVGTVELDIEEVAHNP